jgi:hypothetical protein
MQTRYSEGGNRWVLLGEFLFTYSFAVVERRIDDGDFSDSTQVHRSLSIQVSDTRSPSTWPLMYTPKALLEWRDCPMIHCLAIAFHSNCQLVCKPPMTMVSSQCSSRAQMRLCCFSEDKSRQFCVSSSPATFVSHVIASGLKPSLHEAKDPNSGNPTLKNGTTHQTWTSTRDGERWRNGSVVPLEDSSCKKVSFVHPGLK